jgi:hypothetical protein
MQDHLSAWFEQKAFNATSWKELQDSWPDWVPEHIQQEIMFIWSDQGKNLKRTPSDWIVSCDVVNTPLLGEIVKCNILVQGDNGCLDWKIIEGRYVHVSDNVGYVVLPNKKTISATTHDNGICLSIPFMMPSKDYDEYLTASKSG